MKITREEQDDFAIRSFRLAQASNSASDSSSSNSSSSSNNSSNSNNSILNNINIVQKGAFTHEIIPIRMEATRKAPLTIISKDEGCLKLNEAKLRQLRGAFDRNNGTITAGNASQLSDGAACVIICSGRYLKSRYSRVSSNTEQKKTSQKNDDTTVSNPNAIELDTDDETESKVDQDQNDDSILYPLVEILGYADSAQDPVDFPITPALAIPKAFKRAGMEWNEKNIDFKQDYFEINEAFAVAGVGNARLLKIPIENVNILGGSVALGHPLGCSGARIVVTLINALKIKQGRLGIAGICNGGGGASALVIKNV